MSEYKDKLAGVFPPLTTPFAQQQVAYDKLAENIRRYNDTGLRGYMPLGSNGEFRSLTDEEAIGVVETVARTRASGKTLIAGAGRESASATVEFIKKIADIGVDFASVLTPHYFAGRMTDDALIRYYAAVADRSPVPIMLYNAPKFCAGVCVSPKVIETLAPHPMIAGMKDTSKEEIAGYVNAVPDGVDFWVLAGTINKFSAGLRAGAIGGVLSMADYLPGICCELHALHLAGKDAEAHGLDERARALSKNAAGSLGVAGVKAAMDLLGYYGGEPRVPLMPVTGEERTRLASVLEKEGLL
ncbi:MAG: dihydrodipicolinate synthase family protein [Chitinivibrionales bacterium]|nr:dihydrodipicolinate synthase family protein [Chitinivibrionales bacterium]MBD3394734.1 dihydrodipicolinate synthase family protein [Chitinivibrionales bacterium]